MNHLELIVDIQTVQSIICYQCTDCPLPFSKNYPYVTLSTNTNFEAKCLTTVVKLSDGSRFISKGSAFNCPPATAATDVQLNCCVANHWAEELSVDHTVS
ncbi:unnamed protein product [Rotaria magnacalcarata]|uniref:Uncharacterized protein n=3 Tax=Rotaria magnacalcarata TaxID=392030 RepID=A0A819XBD7_9BILA|nr:unnamed protein product [Rotaria magnacalcarata]CAF4138229.1 unnamed protein product [Rotaria magnacalcarata]